MSWRRVLWPLSGRLNRKGFVFGAVLLTLVPELVALVAMLIAGPIVASLGGSAQALGAAFDQGQTVVAIALLYWSGSLFARRFHDIGWTGWLALVPLAYPAMRIVNKLFGGDPGGDMWRVGPFSELGSALLWIMGAWFVAWTTALLWPGQSRPNRHGPPPSGPWGESPADRDRLAAAFT